MTDIDSDQGVSREDLQEQIEWLNTLNADWRQWNWTRARKEYTDLFGDTIAPGEDYLRRDCGQAFDEHVKLSQRSMARMLHALFEGNSTLQALARQLRQQVESNTMEVMRKALESLRPPAVPDL